MLFADVVGSMKLAAAVDAERLQEIMNELFNRASAVVQRYQGTVDKFTGDGLMALFGAPVALEDHALRACIAALEIQSVTNELAAEVLHADGIALQLRVGLNSGEVIAGEIGSGPGRYTAIGHPVGMAQRMEAAAPAGGVLCSLSTARLVEDATRLGTVEDVAVKGADAPVPARRLLAVESDRMVLGRNEGQMLGRDAELDWLQDVFAANRGCRVGIVGEPGLGKSRLISEFTAIAASQDADIVVARCEAHTTTIAFHALSRLLRAMFKVEGLSDAEAREYTTAQCGGLLAPHSADAQILFEAMGIADANAPPLQVSVDGRRRRLVEVMAQAVLARPTRTVFVLEDAHWIDAPSDDVLADFAATLNVTTSMFVTTYRPEFHGALHHEFGSDDHAATTDRFNGRAPGRPASRRRPVAGGPGRADRSCGGGQPILRRGDRPGPSRPRCAVGESWRLPPDGRCGRNRRPGHGTGGARGPHRSAASRSEVDSERRRGDRQPISTWTRCMLC